MADDARDSIADRRDIDADERDRIADERDSAVDARVADVESIMTAAIERDVAAERRDRRAEARDAAATHRPRAQEDKRDAGAAAIDRWHSGDDRDASAGDRADLVDLGHSDLDAEDARASAAFRRTVAGEARDEAVLERTRAAMEDEPIGGE